MTPASKITTHSMIAALVIPLTVAYIAFYEPFHFVHMVSPIIRILVEFSLLFVFALLWFSRFKPVFIPWGFFIIPLLLLWLFLAGETRTASGSGDGWLPGFVTKIMFLILGANALKYYPSLARVMAKAWVFVWVFTGIQVILSSIVYFLNIAHFSLEGDWRIGIMEYYYHPIFGQLDYRGFKGIYLAQFSGYLMEPLFLGLFAGLNILAAPSLVSKKYEKLFRGLSYITGILSGSFSFILFFCAFEVYCFVKKHSTHTRFVSLMVLGAVGVIVSWLFLVSLGAGEASSFGNRAMRISVAFNALMHYTPRGLLFGTYNYSQIVGERVSASCGVLSFLLQRGILLFVPVMCLFYKYAKKDRYVLAYLFYYSLLLEYFWWPAFVVFLLVFNYAKASPVLGHAQSCEPELPQLARTAY